MTHPDFAEAAAHVIADNVRDLLMALVDIPSATGCPAIRRSSRSDRRAP